jgi:hypothetical protein
VEWGMKGIFQRKIRLYKCCVATLFSSLFTFLFSLKEQSDFLTERLSACVASKCKT